MYVLHVCMYQDIATLSAYIENKRPGGRWGGNRNAWTENPYCSYMYEYYTQFEIQSSTHVPPMPMLITLHWHSRYIYLRL